MEVKHINSVDFDEEVLNYSGIAVVKFSASWCGPCRMLASTIEAMPEKYDNLKIVGIDIDEEYSLARQFGIMSVPTLIFFKDGAEIDKVVGFRNEKQLNELFDKYVNSGK